MTVITSSGNDCHHRHIPALHRDTLPQQPREFLALTAEAAFVEHAEVPVEPWWEAPTHEQEPVESSEVEPSTAPEREEGIYHERGLAGLLRDNDFMNQMVHAMTQSKVMDPLVEDFADKLKDALGSNPEFRQRLVNAVASTETFRRKLVSTLARISG